MLHKWKESTNLDFFSPFFRFFPQQMVKVAMMVGRKEEKEEVCVATTSEEDRVNNRGHVREGL